MSRNEHGLSLVELLIVVTILGVVAAVAVPSFSSTDPKKLELAAAGVANAIRFARSEAIRTGVPHGVRVQTSAQQLRVYWLDTSGSTPTHTYDVRNPVDKKLFHLLFGKDRTLLNMQLSGVKFKFAKFATPREYLGFDATGLPKYNNAGTIHMLESAAIAISDGDQQKTINIEPTTGRVTVN